MPVSGIVLHEKTGRPLAGVLVELLDSESYVTGVEVLTGQDGRFVLPYTGSLDGHRLAISLNDVYLVRGLEDLPNKPILFDPGGSSWGLLIGLVFLILVARRSSK